MAAEGRKEGLCDLSSVVAFGHNEQWLPKAAKVATKLAKISPNGNTGQLALAPRCCACARLEEALGWSSGYCSLSEERSLQTDLYRMIIWKYLIPQFRKRNFDKGHPM